MAACPPHLLQRRYGLATLEMALGDADLVREGQWPGAVRSRNSQLALRGTVYASVGCGAAACPEALPNANCGIWRA